MNYIIDGFNVAFKDAKTANLIRGGNTDAAISGTVALVRRILKNNKGKIVVVFDGKEGQQAPRFPGLTVRFSKAPQKADDIIRAFVRKTKNINRWTVVSSDNEIRFSAQDHGAATLNAAEFLAMKKTTIDPSAEEVKKYEARNIDTEYWLKLFKERDRDE